MFSIDVKDPQKCAGLFVFEQRFEMFEKQQKNLKIPAKK